jgi:hypothetical protein
MQILKKINKLRQVYIFFISQVLFIIIFSTTFLNANTFKVSDIEISGPFELNFNKNKIIDDGFRDSFINLISMITTSGDKDKVKNTSIKELKSLIDSFTIQDENFINNEYFAKLEVSFNKKKILSYLEKKNIFPSIPKKNQILLIPILMDTNTDEIYLFSKNIFYQKWNNNKKNYELLEYLLPSEDLEDLNTIQKLSGSIEEHDFLNMIKKYDLQDYVILTIFKKNNELKILSKINFKNSLKLDNQEFKDINLNNEKNTEFVLNKLKTTYEDHWKKNNEINTSIKLPLTLSIKSKEYKKIQNLEKILENNDLVSKFYIMKFDNQKTYFKIIYNGSPKTFFNDLSKKNYEITLENDIWTVL